IDRGNEGFEWIDLGHVRASVFAFLRKAQLPSNHLLVALNFSDQPVHDYYLEPFDGLQYKVVFNSDSAYYGGRNLGSHWGEQESQRIALPPFSAMLMKPV